MKIKFPGIKILDRYIIRKFLGTYLFAIGLIIVIVVIFDYAEKVDDFIETKATFSSIIFDYYLNFVPYFINQFSGLFTFIAVIFFTSKMAYNTEIIAMLSGGMSFKRLMWPYFVSSMAITALALILSLWIIPRANERRLAFEMQHIKKNLNAKYDTDIYRQIDPGTFVYLRSFVGQDVQKANYFAIEKYEDNKLVEVLEAADATYVGTTGRWRAPKYTIRKLYGEEEEFLQFQRLDTLINLNADELGKVEQYMKTMNITELNTFIDQQKGKGSDMIPVFEVERQSRFSYPAATFILTLIGVSLSSRKVRGGTGLHIGLGIGLCFTYILFGRFAEEFAKGGVLPAAFAVWIPNLIFLLIAVWLYVKAPK